MFPVFFMCRSMAFTRLSHSPGNGSKEAERGCIHSVMRDLDLLFLKEQKQEGNVMGQLQRKNIIVYIYTHIYIHTNIYSSTEWETYQRKKLDTIEWSMRNRLTTEAGVNSTHDSPTPAISPLKGNEGPGIVLQNLEDFSKFTFTGVNLKGLLPGTQNWATVWQRQYLMQQASEENKSSCYWLHRTFKIYYKQV